MPNMFEQETPFVRKTWSTISSMAGNYTSKSSKTLNMLTIEAMICIYY
jgi:hypothetical protein